MTGLVAITFGVAVLAAVRSTWSPCGLSMLATITPLAEQGRGHRFRSTALWYLVGGVAGGATLGAVMCGLAGVMRVLAPGPTLLAMVAMVAAVVAAASDIGFGGYQLPIHRRQVNERWLDRYRPWVYGCGFGWQIGSGFSTYIMTASVYLLVVLAALTATPLAALAVGTVFGTVRGAMVFMGRSITSPEALRAFHARFIGTGTGIAVVTAGVMGVVAVAAGGAISLWLAVGLATVGVVIAPLAARSIVARGSCVVEATRNPQSSDIMEA